MLYNCISMSKIGFPIITIPFLPPNQTLPLLKQIKKYVVSSKLFNCQPHHKYHRVVDTTLTNGRISQFQTFLRSPFMARGLLVQIG